MAGLKRFYLTKKNLAEAKPCVVQLLRDDGTIEWYENAKAGQLVKINTGKEKAYINLDQEKLVNLAGEGEEEEVTIDELVKDSNGEQVTDSKGNPKVERKTSKIKDILGKYINLSSKKKKNFGTGEKPIMGFICYEKEFNALPNKVMHDSRQVTSWMDFIIKNFKSFELQKIEGIKSIIIVIGIIIIVGIFVFFKYGGDWLTAGETVKVGAEAVAALP